MSDTSHDGIRERQFTLDGIPGVLWSPVACDGPLPLILIGHGGGQHKQASEVAGRAYHFVVEGGFAVASVDVPNHGDRPHDAELSRLAERMQAEVAAGADLAGAIAGFQARVSLQTVPEWRAVLDALQEHLGSGPVGYWGVSLGCGLGVPFVAAEPRVRAAVLGLGGAYANAELAAAITVPVEFLVQWEDERIPREQSLALFDALGSAEKTLHANPGKHGELPSFETDSSLRFFVRHFDTGTKNAA
jgi:dienelactone hydrolase